MPTNNNSHKPELTPFLLWLMTITTAIVVGNIYYSQPLLGDIAKDLHINNSKAGQVSMFTQIGYATGLLFIIPLGDMFRRKRLMLIDLAVVTVSLIGVATATNIYVLFITSFLVGLTTVIPQLLIPMVAHLAKPEERGKKIGFIMSGLLIGILLSRTLSGFVGEHFGWRAIFYAAAVMMVIIWLLIYWKLPEVAPTYAGTYSDLMKSLKDLFIAEPKLRLASFRGALLFAAFSAFWSTLVFLLKQPPLNQGSAVAGAFGLVGAFGALAAGLMGRLSDKVDAFKLSAFTILMVTVSFIVYYFSSASIAGLIIGVILMDIGVQATHISNQAIIFALNPDARNRINTIYMVSYFVGGSAGTFAASLVWGGFGWAGVCGIGTILSVIVLFVHLVNRKKMQTA
ncbi:MFS transporter [Mucilaginibacter ginkgonis]|uniref:MFS transporter n=1 Tax=Mucilaginibacter ginkgonis TaxID=2682091 RepID=A0A7T7F7R1_9SPHI|nr:MFS transporter [Mucilaginibacter ginkgonis]QQL48329.1 MFS transporter [Mucilaginibacter ginkgonis]